MELLRISLVQYDIAWENPPANRLKLEKLTGQLAGNTDLVLLPEMFVTGFSMNARELAEKTDGPTVLWMRSMAEKTGAAFAGSLIIEENNQFFNRFLFVTPAGETEHYDKRHLFSIGTEDRYFSHGNRQVTVDYLGWKIALYTCYDLRFPVWCRTGKSADLLLFSANWPSNRKNVWQTLLRARAIENQVYVAGVNRVGTDGAGIGYDGESTVTGPKGYEILEMAGGNDTVGSATLSLPELRAFREKFPVWMDADSFDLKK